MLKCLTTKLFHSWYTDNIKTPLREISGKQTHSVTQTLFIQTPNWLRKLSVFLKAGIK